MHNKGVQTWFLVSPLSTKFSKNFLKKEHFIRSEYLDLAVVEGAGRQEKGGERVVY